MGRLWLFLLIGLNGFLFSPPAANSSAKNIQENSAEMIDEKRLEGLVAAPDFPEGMEWLNVSRPISLKELRGKIVLLDFWTYCCINCMHVLPELKKLEEKYPNELVVIGVHSAKFLNEKGTESIRQAILRYEVKHPVVNDHELEVWQAYAVRAWPTLSLINPRGKIIGVHSGENVFEVFDPIIRQTIDYYDQRKEIDRKPFKIELEEVKSPKTLLAFPGKISADNPSKKLIISDSNHNRILISESSGKIVDVIGSGRQGRSDGAFDSAEFHHPQGTFLAGDILYIADTENHMIRAADLKSRQVVTLFGTGEQARRYSFSGKGRQVALNSPWDLLVHNGVLFIAMAGSHQLYAADLKNLEIQPYAGSGREARVDGSLMDAALAQPSGITTDGSKLYFADSEVSSIRSADLAANGQVETLIGEDLFEFGDVDGDSRHARLQHALGVVYHEGKLYVADTYNSKIKVIDPKSKTSETLAGTGKHGDGDGNFNSAEFFEPSGLTILDGSLFVADTNNHLIRKLNLTSNQVTTLELSGIEKMAKSQIRKNKFREILLPAQTILPGEGKLLVDVKVPSGYKLTPGVSPQLSWRSNQEKAFLFRGSSRESSEVKFPFEIEFESHAGRAELTMEAIIYYCRTDSTLCFFDHQKVVLPVKADASGDRQDLSIDLNVLIKDKSKR